MRPPLLIAVLLLVAVLTAGLTIPQTADAKRVSRRTIPGALLGSGGAAVSLVDPAFDAGRALARLPLQRDRPAPDPLDLAARLGQLRQACAAAARADCSGPVAAPLVADGAALAAHLQALTSARPPIAAAARRALVVLRLGLGQPVSGGLVSRSHSLRDRLEDLWLEHAVAARQGDRKGQLRALARIEAQAGRAAAPDGLQAAVLRAEVLAGLGRDGEADRLRHRLLARFRAWRLPADGGLAAQAAGRAQAALLQRANERVMAFRLVAMTRDGPDAEMASYFRQIRTLANLVLGPVRSRALPEGTTELSRRGGLHERWTQLVDFGDVDLAYLGYTRAARELQHLARTIYSAPPPPVVDDEGWGGCVLDNSTETSIENHAYSLLRAVVAHAAAHGRWSPVVAEARIAIHQYAPADFPLTKPAAAPDPADSAPMPEPTGELR